MEFYKTIFEQLDGNKFQVMTGAKNFCYSEKEMFLSFSIGKNSKGINRVKITLTPADDYTMQFAYVRGANYKVKKTVEGVYCDMLQDVFTMVTGMYTNYFKGLNMRIYSNKERSAAIRAELKKLGYNSKQVSVRSGNCGYSDSSHITIKDVSIRIAEVRKVCAKFESIDYDKYTGEILEGGNTYIIVQYDYEAMRKAEEEKLEKVEELLKGIDKGEQKKIERKDCEYVLYSDSNGFYMACYKKGENFGKLGFRSWTFESFKHSIARAIVTDFEDYAA